MNNTRTTLFCLAASVALCSGFSLIKPDMDHEFELRFKGGESEEHEKGGAGNEASAKRFYWELNRLVDPATGRIPEGMRYKELAFAGTLPSDGLLPYTKSINSALNYNARGPYNHGGRTRALAVDVDNDDIMIAGQVSGGIWRTTDGGQSWNKVSPLNDVLGTTCITQDVRPGHHNTWYYGTGEGYGTSASAGGAFFLGNGLYKSTDGGMSWSHLASTGAGTPQPFDNVWEITWNVATDPSNMAEDELYAATYGAVWRSIDGGTTWTIVRGSQNGSYFTNVIVTPAGVVYATLSSDGTQSGIWRSTDGTNWTNITPGGFGTTYNRIVMNYNPQNENEVYFLGVTPGSGQSSTNFLGETEENSLWKYTYVSGDGTGAGGVWDDRSASLPSGPSQFGNFNAQGGYNLAISVKPNDPNTVFIGGTNIFRSTDAFATPNNTTQIGGYGVGTTTPFFLSYPSHHPDQHTFAFIPSEPNSFVCGNDGGLFKTTDVMAQSVTWTPLNRGYQTIQFYTVGIDKTVPNDPVIIGGTQDNATLYTNSTDPQFNWTLPFNGDGAYCAITAGGQYYYYSRQLGQVVKSTMNSNTGLINQLTRIDPATIDTNRYDFINVFTLDPNDQNIMYMAGGDRLYRNRSLDQFTLDGTYTRKDAGWDFLSATIDTNRTITAITACQTPAHRVYFGTNKRKIYRVDNADSNSPTVTEITSTTSPSVMPSAGNISSIAVDPTNGDNIIAVFSNYAVYSIFSSTNAGASWTRVAGNLEQTTGGGGNGPSVRWASILPLQDGNTAYFVGTSTGLYATDSLNGLNTVWVQQGAATIGNAIVNVVETRPSDGLIVVATHGDGMFTSNITNIGQITTVKDINPVEASGVKLYPNPASGNATIEFELKTKQKVLVTIHDELGRAIRIVHNGDLPAGIQRFNIAQGSMAKGIYYCTVWVGRTRQSRQLIWID
jgi:photosystem II stability/assembly factor-like uncharacterized protein